MSIWDQAAAKMDAKVDELLGDTVSFSSDGGQTFADVQAFVIDDTDPAPAFGGDFDETATVSKRIKIAVTILGGRPSKAAHRFRHSRLGAGTWRPLGAEPRSEGRYWVFGVEKASA